MWLRAAHVATNMDGLYQVLFLSWIVPNLKLRSHPRCGALMGLEMESDFFITGGTLMMGLPNFQARALGLMNMDVRGQQLSWPTESMETYCGRSCIQLPVYSGKLESFCFIILDECNAPNIPKLSRFLLFIGLICVLLGFFHGRTGRKYETARLSEGFACLLGRNHWLWICS